MKRQAGSEDDEAGKTTSLPQDTAVDYNEEDGERIDYSQDEDDDGGDVSPSESEAGPKVL